MELSLTCCDLCNDFLFFLFFWPAFRRCGRRARRARLTGTVTDATGAVISGATVTVLGPTSGYNQTTKTDANGQYRFSNLPFNRYHVAVSMTGFEASSQDAPVRSAAGNAADFKLAIATTNQTVNVEAEANDMVNTDPTSSTTVDRDLFVKLPTESTSSALSSLVTLSTPGIAADSNGLFHPMGEHSDTTYFDRRAAGERSAEPGLRQPAKCECDSVGQRDRRHCAAGVWRQGEPGGADDDAVRAGAAEADRERLLQLRELWEFGGQRGDGPGDGALRQLREL